MVSSAGWPSWASPYTRDGDAFYAMSCPTTILNPADDAQGEILRNSGR